MSAALSRETGGGSGMVTLRKTWVAVDKLGESALHKVVKMGDGALRVAQCLLSKSVDPISFLNVANYERTTALDFALKAKLEESDVEVRMRRMRIRFYLSTHWYSWYSVSISIPIGIQYSIFNSVLCALLVYQQRNMYTLNWRRVFTTR